MPHKDATRNEHQVCFKCWERHLNAQIESHDGHQLTCASCDQTLEEAEIVQLERSFYKGLSKKIDERSLLAVLREDPNWVSCPSATCRYGASMIDGHIFTCQACDLRYCFSCQVPFHEGITCSEWLRRQEERAEEERLTSLAVEQHSKGCPNCATRLQKNGSCDHFTCRVCNHEFCWVCFAPFRGEQGVWRIGNSAHAQACRYHTCALPNYHGPAPLP